MGLCTMKKTIEKLDEYFERIGAGGIKIVPSLGVKEKLPVFMSQAYMPYCANIFGKEYLLFVAVGGLHPTPAETEKQLNILKNALDENVAFVFEGLPTYDRKRFSERGIPFIVPGLQTFLPPALIDLKEIGGGCSATKVTKLSAPSQVVLLYYLQNNHTKGWTLNKWAETLKYSNSTLTRVRRELEVMGLCHAEGNGRSVVFSFPKNRHKVWKKSKSIMRSPVRNQSHVFLGETPEGKLFESGFSALSSMSMLAGGQSRIYAMSASAYQSAIEDGWIRTAPVSADQSVIVERWRYAPGLLSNDGISVDRLSLYLSLRNDPNERVQAEINGIEKQMLW